jgi:acyl carrier protein
MALEEEFDCEINDEVAEHIDSVDKAVEYLTNNLG